MEQFFCFKNFPLAVLRIFKANSFKARSHFTAAWHEMFSEKEKKKKARLIPHLVSAVRAHPAADGPPARHSLLRPICPEQPRSLGWQTLSEKVLLHLLLQRSRKGTRQSAWGRGYLLTWPGGLGPGICRDQSSADTQTNFLAVLMQANTVQATQGWSPLRGQRPV